MNAPLRPMLLALGALSLGGVLVLKSARASEPSTFDTAIDSKAKDGGGWVTLGHKDGGSIDLADKGKDGGMIELSLVKGGKEGGSIELLAKSDSGK
jgi:hypothetical protein